MNWRSFWTGGCIQRAVIRWSVSVWPTIDLIDVKDVVRERSEGLPGAELDEAVASLVAEAAGRVPRSGGAPRVNLRVPGTPSLICE
jgi:hypothetical protein